MRRCKGLEKAAVKTNWGRERISRLVSLSFISKRSQRTFDETRQVDIIFFLLDQTKQCLGSPNSLVEITFQLPVFYFKPLHQNNYRKTYVHTYLELDMSISFRRNKVY